jgi:putative transposase
MSHTYAHNPVHVVFSTNERRKLISKQSQPRLWAYLAGVCSRQKIFVHEIGGMEDHPHMLIEIPLTMAFSDALQEIKTSSSRWMGRDFAWQRGFGLFGVSASNMEHGDSIHPDPGGASPENELRRGIHRVVEKTSRGI